MLPDIHRATQKFYIFLIVYLTGCTPNLLNFVTLCCGILTIETSHSFLRSFCFIGQNGAFSTTEQNQ
jgi:hypothetical protein